MKVHVSEEERRQLTSAVVTLNGEPARIAGINLDFPRVVQIRSGLSAEYSWSTVRHVVDNCAGQFRTV